MLVQATAYVMPAKAQTINDYLPRLTKKNAAMLYRHRKTRGRIETERKKRWPNEWADEVAENLLGREPTTEEREWLREQYKSLEWSDRFFLTYYGKPSVEKLEELHAEAYADYPKDIPAITKPLPGGSFGLPSDAGGFWKPRGRKITVRFDNPAADAAEIALAEQELDLEPGAATVKSPPEEIEEVRGGWQEVMAFAVWNSHRDAKPEALVGAICSAAAKIRGEPNREHPRSVARRVGVRYQTLLEMMRTAINEADRLGLTEKIKTGTYNESIPPGGASVAPREAA